MKKQSFTTEKSKLIAEKSVGLNIKINQIQTDLDNETLHIATKPPKLTIKVIPKENCNYAEHYPMRSKQVRSRRDWVEGDVENESENGNGMSLMSIKDWQESDDNTDRDEFDIQVGEKIYRVIIDKTLDRIWCREISEYDYTGRALFKNPVDKEKSGRLQKFIIELNLLKTNRLDTMTHARKEVLKFYEQEELNGQSRRNPVGKEPKASLIRATLWCIRNHPKNLIHKRPTILRAYKKFGEEDTESSFVRSVYRKWNNFEKEYRAQPAEFKKQNSKENYARKIFRVPRNYSKQRTKKNEI
jgi:hypothetical protein